MFLEDNQEAFKMTKVIKLSAELLLYLVNDMLDVYMLKNGKFQKIEVTFKMQRLFKDLQKMFDLQASAKEVKLNLVFKNQLPYKVTGDERRLKQVIVNLLSNAMKFTP